MKGKSLKNLFFAAIMLSFAIPSLAQNGNGATYASAEDSIKCGKYLSSYRTFFRLKLYDDTYPTWWKAFKECPQSSVRLYADGATMYRFFIEEAPEGPVREGLIDTLMLIYDQRMEYMGDEGNVLGRKARDLLTYRGENMDDVQSAYEMLSKSVELRGNRPQEPVMLLLISSGLALNEAGRLEDGQVIEDYLIVSGILDKLEGRSSRWKRARASIDEMVLGSDVLTCESLNAYYEPQFEQIRSDEKSLKELIALHKAVGCDRTDIFVAASEDLYRLAPGPESAHNLGILFITKNEFEKSAVYLQEAVQGQDIDPETRADWYYELAVVSNALEEYCEAIKYARAAIKLKENLGKAYIALGDAYIASRSILGDDFQQRAAFWAAVDMYKKAARMDPSLREESRKKASDYSAQFPSQEEVFFRDLKDGDSFQVEGCINETTKVRSGK